VLLATVLGQDLDTGEDGVFRIARRVAKDRVISTVDPQTNVGKATGEGRWWMGVPRAGSAARLPRCIWTAWRVGGVRPPPLSAGRGAVARRGLGA